MPILHYVVVLAEFSVATNSKISLGFIVHSDFEYVNCNSYSMCITNFK